MTSLLAMFDAKYKYSHWQVWFLFFAPSKQPRPQGAFPWLAGETRPGTRLPSKLIDEPILGYFILFKSDNFDVRYISQNLFFVSRIPLIFPTNVPHSYNCLPQYPVSRETPNRASSMQLPQNSLFISIISQ